jgi:glycine/D-amino acid oxidase-like deaminating enzyme
MEASAQYLGKHAIVIGGGIAGMLTARVLSEFFERVTVLERDNIGDSLKSRRSVPQGHHAHFLLKGGEQSMENLFPELVKEMVELGSVPLRILARILSSPASWNSQEETSISHATVRLAVSWNVASADE